MSKTPLKKPALMAQNVTNTPPTERLSCVVVGAGPAGIVALKVLRQKGIQAVALEREDDVGGNWYFGRNSSSVYQSTHLITSKRFTEFPGFPMPDGYPAYPSHEQMLAYTRGFAKHHGLYDSIRFNANMRQATPDAQGWRLDLADNETPLFCDNLIVATGNYWCPRLPSFSGEFTGRVMHSREYKSPDQVRDKHVVVVGNGNTGCDLAVESGQVAKKVYLSVREGRFLMPKFMFGIPSDQVGDWTFKYGMPRWLRAALSWFPIHISVGPLNLAGLPKPAHKLFARQPIMNTQLPQAIGHGRIEVKPQIARLEGSKVYFVDGSCVQADLVICATGYQLRFPFLPADIITWDHDHPRLYLNIAPPERNNLFFVGMIEPRTKFPELVHLQSELIAEVLRTHGAGDSRPNAFQRTKQTSPSRSEHSQEEFLACEYYTYRRHLQRAIRQLSLP